MTKPNDDIRPFRPFSGPLTLLQFLGSIALIGLGLSLVAHYLI